jgi:betaine-aldehyde dehydrogenase
MSEIAKHWIDGEWTSSGTVSESVNPATGAVLGRRDAIPSFQV